jgi:arsenate reductase
MSAHWGVEDPATATGNELQRETAFVTAFKYLHNRINLFAALPLKSIERSSLRARLKEIGESEGSTSLLTQPE